MTLFRVEVSRETEAVMLYMQSACGLRPLIGWHNMGGMKEFADMLMDIYNRRTIEKCRIREASDDILGQVLDNDTDYLEKESRA